MFTPEELKNGAKRAVLEYIAGSGIQIAKIYTPDEARALGPNADLIVRADNACQLDAFSGVFGSYRTHGDRFQVRNFPGGHYLTPSELGLDELIAIAGLDQSFRSGKHEREEIVQYNIADINSQVRWYCDQSGLARPDRPSILIQEAHSDSIAMFQHPNNPNLVVIGMNKRTILYDRRTDSFTYFAPKYEWERQFFDNMPVIDRYGGDFARLRDAIGTYDKASSLPKLIDTESTLEMESGWHRKDGSTIVYQVRLGRKIEHADFRLPPESGKNVINFDLPVGLSPSPGGSELNLTRTYNEKNYSGSAAVVFPIGTDDSNSPPHVNMPGISALLIPVFDYRRDHGIREAIMKTPLSFCNISELNGKTTGSIAGVKSGNSEIPQVREQGYALAEEALHMLFDEGMPLRLFSDGITGRVVLD